jgi:hypothetical protein
LANHSKGCREKVTPVLRRTARLAEAPPVRHRR